VLPAWGALATVLLRARALLAQAETAPTPAAEAQPFDWEWLKGQARELARQPFTPLGEDRPPQLQALTWDQYNAIRFRPDHALWVGTDLAFQIQFFHLGIFYRHAVQIYQVDDGQARRIAYDPAMFDYGPNKFDPPLPPDLGFAGFRVHFHEDFRQDVAVFEGASYFRATDRDSQYGMSCRGLAVDTGMERPEEFPVFTRFWLVRPRPSDTVLTVYALLEGESATGAYRFGVAPGGITVMDVDALVIARKPIERLGLAPLTSMYQFGENDRRASDDWRQEIHDSDGLAMWRGNGEWAWRPLVNPPQLRVSYFADENPKGFGLLQRDRAFDHYQDEGARYERRPSVWVEPTGGWGKGGIHLIEIPTGDETFDNIVAFWTPAEPVEAGQERELTYKLHWCPEPPFRPEVAVCVATRIGRGGIIGQPVNHNLRKFVVDFSGGDLPLVPKGAPVEPVITVSRGQVEQLTALDGRILISPLARPLPQVNGWRITFDLSWEGIEPIDIRMFLRMGPTTLTETWLYQWTPPHA
jgi:periplasmic glucans biosynthesis protein